MHFKESELSGDLPVPGSNPRRSEGGFELPGASAAARARPGPLSALLPPLISLVWLSLPTQGLKADSALSPHTRFHSSSLPPHPAPWLLERWAARTDTNGQRPPPLGTHSLVWTPGRGTDGTRGDGFIAQARSNQDALPGEQVSKLCAQDSALERNELSSCEKTQGKSKDTVLRDRL